MEGAFGKMRDQFGKMSSSCSHLVKIEHRISIEGTTMTAMARKKVFMVNVSFVYSKFRLMCFSNSACLSTLT